MTVPELTENQIGQILTEALSRGMYETPNGNLPDDLKQRADDAKALVSAVSMANKNGNKSDNVQTIMFIANNAEQTVTEAVANGDTFIAPAREPEPEAKSEIDGFDITQVSDGVLEGLIIGLDKFPNNADVEAERKAYLSEKERRSNGSPQEIQEVPQGEAAQEVIAEAGEIAPEGSPSTVEAASQQPAETERSDTGSVAGDGDTGRSVGNEDANAGAFARAQTPETSKEEKTKAKAPEEDGNRLKLESELDLPMVRSHGVDITKLASLTTEQLEFIIANPEGPPKETKMPVVESEVEGSALHADRGGASIGGISLPQPADPIVSKNDLGLGNVEPDEPTVSEEREKLETLVTGPMLKAYARGRKEVPNIGDNELRFMILHADGKVSQEELAVARSQDSPDETVMEQKKPLPMNPIQQQQEALEKSQQEQLDKEAEALVQPDRTIAQAAAEAVATNVLPEAEIASPELPSVQTTPIAIQVSGESKVAEIPKETVDAYEDKTGYALKEPMAVQASGQARAMEIIKGENFPIPPDIEGEPPRLPNDVSKCSRDELFSLHAGFHACESRINWVISTYEDELGDIEKLKANREITVAASVPLVLDDKRVTNEYRDAQVAADSQVRDFDQQAHEMTKTVKKLKVLQRNYHSDCERLSRQMSKYERERLDAPR